jgi:hypothetical protein
LLWHSYRPGISIGAFCQLRMRGNVPYQSRVGPIFGKEYGFSRRA